MNSATIKIVTVSVTNVCTPEQMRDVTDKFGPGLWKMKCLDETRTVQTFNIHFNYSCATRQLS